ncbi:MAG TPA: Hsp20/alpha crystallin family protein [Candidatus Methylomirabilis sp.]|nr:Hsp20/alpha crystallin family protein [Candidatus Methylomirabilis sp.]
MAPSRRGRIEDGTYVIQLPLPGMDPKEVEVSLMDNVLTVKGERKADHDTTGKDYFVREVATARSSGVSRSQRASTSPKERRSTRTACSRCGFPRRELR